MGRLLLILGVPLMIIGILGMTLGPFLGGGFFSSLGTTIQTVTNADLTAAQFCRDGETLVIDQGPLVRTNASSSTMGRTTLYYCQSANGERRDVTGEAIGNVLSGATGIFDNIASFLPFRLEFVGAFVVGLIMTIVGANLARRAMIQRLLESGGVASMAWDVNQMSPRVMVSTRQATSASSKQAQDLFDQISRAATGSAQSAMSAGGTDLTAKLEQLEQAYEKRLISQEEYTRLRKEILDSLS